MTLTEEIKYLSMLADYSGVTGFKRAVEIIKQLQNQLTSKKD